MTIPTEPIGSIPRPAALLDGYARAARGELDAVAVAALEAEAIADTIRRFEATGSPVVTDGEQTKPSFATYPLSAPNALASDGAVIPFADGHTRQLPRLTAGPFRWANHAGGYVRAARALTSRPVKQAVIAPSALSLLYQGEVPDYSRAQFIADLLAGAEAEIRGAFDAGAHVVQLDFTEGRLALKLDPSGGVLRAFVDLNNQLLQRFTAEERARLGVHTCPGGDHDSTHSADIDYAELIPTLFELAVGNFYVQLASEADRPRVLGILRGALRPGQRVFIGVTDPIDAKIETAEVVRDRVLEAAKILPLDQLGTTDDCGFSPFADDTSTARDTAFAKIAARVAGTALAATALGLA